MRNFDPLILDTNESPVFNPNLSLGTQSLGSFGGNNGPQALCPLTHTLSRMRIYTKGPNCDLTSIGDSEKWYCVCWGGRA